MRYNLLWPKLKSQGSVLNYYIQGFKQFVKALLREERGGGAYESLVWLFVHCEDGSMSISIVYYCIFPNICPRLSPFYLVSLSFTFVAILSRLTRASLLSTL